MEVEKEPVPKGLAGEFVAFIKKYSVVGLAIGIVVGTTVTRLVTALVEGLINPFIGLFLQVNSLGELTYTVNASVFKVGEVLLAAINFLIVALLIFIVVQKLLKWEPSPKK